MLPKKLYDVEIITHLCIVNQNKGMQKKEKVSNKMQNERKRPSITRHLATKYDSSMVYVGQIISGVRGPTKGKGLAILRDVQRIYEEPITQAEWEN